MFNWLRKKSDTQNELLLQVKEIRQKLQQVLDDNQKLQNDVIQLQENVKEKVEVDGEGKGEEDPPKEKDFETLRREQMAKLNRWG